MYIYIYKIINMFLNIICLPPFAIPMLCFCQKCEVLDIGSCYSIEAFGSALLGRLIKSRKHHVAGQRWQLFFSSSISSGAFDEVSPETLWEVKLLN